MDVGCLPPDVFHISVTPDFPGSISISVNPTRLHLSHRMTVTGPLVMFDKTTLRKETVQTWMEKVDSSDHFLAVIAFFECPAAL